MNNPESGFPWWMKIFTVIICLFLLAALWYNHLNTLPDIKTPVTKMPNPNAYDYFMAAANSLVDKEIIDGAYNKKPSIPVNPSKAQIIARFGNTKMYSQSTALRFPTEAEKTKALKDNSKALDYFRTGLEYEYKAPQIKSITEMFPFLIDYRTLVRLMYIESKSYESNKNWNAAMQIRLDGIEFGVKIAYGGFMLSGVNLEAISRGDIYLIIRNLTFKESIDSANMFENILGTRIPLANIIEEEKNIMIRTYMEQFQKPRWQHEMTVFIMEYDGLDYETLAFKSKLTLYGKRSIMNGLIGFYDEYIEISKKPYTVNPPAITIPKDPLNQIFCSHLVQYNHVRFLYEKNRAFDYILLLELALKAYKLENGTYPEKLANLVPKYLTKLPDDPFALKGTFKYKKINDKYLLYSLGPDCKDDGGKPITYSTNKKFVNEDSKGDIVAGINFK